MISVKDAIRKVRSTYEDIGDKSVSFGFSGGVDSSVLGVILNESGFKTRGFHAICWTQGDYCTADQDLKDALSVTSRFGISLEVLHLEQEYRQYVLNPFVEMCRQGFVPNIDILCNNEIKFGAILRKLVSLNSEYLATGHYADKGTVVAGGLDLETLKIPSDKAKDQTYFLSQIIRKPGLVGKLIFPGALFNKTEIRSLAKELGLPNADKPDSQGICFVGNVGMKEFLKDYIVSGAGNVVDTSGKVIGTHSGALYYAIGQRHGFDINQYSSAPLYIVSKDVANNLLVVGTKEEASSSEARLFNFFSFFNDVELNSYIKKQNLFVRFRNLGRLVKVSGLSVDHEEVIIKLSESEFGLTPGQEAVLYLGDLLIGSGTLSK